MLVVIGIIGLLVAASVPSFASYGKQARLKATTRQLIGFLTLARQNAISASATRTVVIDPAEKEIVIEESLTEDEPKRFAIPQTVQVASSAGGADGPWEVIFLPSGALEGHTTTLTLTSEGKSLAVTVIGATGAVSLKSAAVPDAQPSPETND